MIKNTPYTTTSPIDDDVNLITTLSKSLNNENISDSFSNKEEIKYINPRPMENSRTKLADSIHRYKDLNTNSTNTENDISKLPYIIDNTKINE